MDSARIIYGRRPPRWRGGRHACKSTDRSVISPGATVLREKGYRIGFYSSEPDEPAHVHVHKAGSEAKFWLDPVQLSWNKGYRENELREIARILEEHEIELLEAWNETE